MLRINLIALSLLIATPIQAARIDFDMELRFVGHSFSGPSGVSITEYSPDLETTRRIRFDELDAAGDKWGLSEDFASLKPGDIVTFAGSFRTNPDGVMKELGASWDPEARCDFAGKRCTPDVGPVVGKFKPSGFDLAMDDMAMAGDWSAGSDVLFESFSPLGLFYEDGTLDDGRRWSAEYGLKRSEFTVVFSEFTDASGNRFLTSVPAPASAWLLLAGMGLVASLRRWRGKISVRPGG